MSLHAKVTFWGVRGSVASAGRSTMQYGGNTICLAVSYGKTLIICDAGTGIRPLGDELKAHATTSIKATILLSHLHWDHVMGLPFFEPLYDRGNQFVIGAPAGGVGSCKQAIAGIMRPPYFPITPGKFLATMTYRTIRGSRFKVDNIVVEPFSCFHPGGSFGWKFIFPNKKTLIHVSDNEPSLRNREQMLKWMHGADLVIHDAQYSPREYAEHRGWGHSPHTYPVEMAIAAGCKRIFLYHYDPSTDDRTLEVRLEQARVVAAKYRSGLKVDLAREGRTVLV